MRTKNREATNKICVGRHDLREIGEIGWCRRCGAIGRRWMKSAENWEWRFTFPKAMAKGQTDFTVGEL